MGNERVEIDTVRSVKELTHTSRRQKRTGKDVIEDEQPMPRPLLRREGADFGAAAAAAAQQRQRRAVAALHHQACYACALRVHRRPADNGDER